MKNATESPNNDPIPSLATIELLTTANRHRKKFPNTVPLLPTNTDYPVVYTE